MCRTPTRRSRCRSTSRLPGYRAARRARSNRSWSSSSRTRNHGSRLVNAGVRQQPETDKPTENRIELWELIARESIRDLIARYNANLDTARYDQAMELFA